MLGKPTVNNHQKDRQGLLLLNKSGGMTSQQALQKARRILDPKGKIHAGHIGTLDPMAEGLLPLMFGETTRYAYGLERADKAYIATIAFGGQSTTDDREGVITEMPAIGAEYWREEKMREVLSHFVGQITQIPPHFSSVRVEGKRLYHWVRGKKRLKVGEVVTPHDSPIINAPTPPPRQVTVHSIHLLTLMPDTQSIRIKVSCGSGTYIRALARDMGKMMGSGGYLTALTRTQVGRFTLSEAINLTDLQSAGENDQLEQWLLPSDTMVEQYPAIVVRHATKERLYCGQRIGVYADFAVDGRPIPPTTHPNNCRYRLYWVDEGVDINTVKMTLPTCFNEPTVHFFGMAELTQDPDGSHVLRPRRLTPKAK